MCVCLATLPPSGSPTSSFSPGSKAPAAASAAPASAIPSAGPSASPPPDPVQSAHAAQSRGVHCTHTATWHYSSHISTSPGVCYLRARRRLPYFFLMLRFRFFSIWQRLLWESVWSWLLRFFCSLLRFHTCSHSGKKRFVYYFQPHTQGGVLNAVLSASTFLRCFLCSSLKSFSCFFISFT